MNTLVAAATASISIEESENVLFANLFFIDPICFIYFENWSRFR